MPFAIRLRLVLPIPAVCVLLALFLPAAAHAQRKGFVLNLGLGVGETKWSANGDNSLSNGGIATDFKIGHAPSDQLLIYYTNDASFFSLEGTDDQLVVSGLSGVGGTYFLKPAAPSFFFDASLGISAFNILDTDGGGTESYTGLGIGVGGGYEFARHWLVDLDVVFGSPDGDGLSLDTRTFRLAINWLLY